MGLYRPAPSGCHRIPRPDGVARSSAGTTSPRRSRLAGSRNPVATRRPAGPVQALVDARRPRQKAPGVPCDAHGSGRCATRIALAMLRQVLAYGRATGTAYPRSAALLGDSSPRRVPTCSEQALLCPPVAVAEHRSPGRFKPRAAGAKPGMASQSAGPGMARRVARPGREAQGTPDRCLIRGRGAGRPFFSSLFFGRAKKRDPPVRGGAQRRGGLGIQRESAAPRFSQ